MLNITQLVNQEGPEHLRSQYSIMSRKNFKETAENFVESIILKMHGRQRSSCKIQEFAIQILESLKSADGTSIETVFYVTLIGLCHLVLPEIILTESSSWRHEVLKSVHDSDGRFLAGKILS
jgi:hypothetical protein